MQIFIAITLIVVGVALFLAKKNIKDDDLERAANVGSVIATFAGIIILAFYTSAIGSSGNFPTLPQEKISITPTLALSLTPMVTLVPSYTPSPSITPSPTVSIPTITPSPSDTPQPTNTPRPESLSINFTHGMPDTVKPIYGNYSFIGGALVTSDQVADWTLLEIGDDNWQNYQVYIETERSGSCFGPDAFNISAHAKDQDNMVMLGWNYCEGQWWEYLNGNRLARGYELPGFAGGSNGKFNVRYVADGGNFSVYINSKKFSEYYDERFVTGKIYILLHHRITLYSILITPLP
jgi:hypothetical protein